MQCWKLSRNEATINSTIQGKIHRQIRTQNSGSHGSNGPPAGATDLGQDRRTHNRHQGSRTSPSAEAKVGWRLTRTDHPGWPNHGRHNRPSPLSSRFPIGPQGWFKVQDVEFLTMLTLAPTYKYEGKGLKWRHTTSDHSLISLLLSPYACGV